jgi:hypothetical protein
MDKELLYHGLWIVAVFVGLKVGQDVASLLISKYGPVMASTSVSVPAHAA